MRGFGGITDSINALFAGLGIAVPAWAIPAILVGGFLFLLPHIRQNQRTNLARKAIRDLSQGGSDDPVGARSEIIALAHAHPVTLVVIADEAVRRGMLPLAKLALKHLEATGKRPLDRRRLQSDIYGSPLHIESEIAAIEALLVEKAHEAALQRIERANLNWPGNKTLEALAIRASVREE